MKSLIVQVRLTPAEAAILDAIRTFKDRNPMNRSECLRMLVLREHRRRLKRKGSPPTAVAEREFVSDMRVGRPRISGENNERETVHQET